MCYSAAMRENARATRRPPNPFSNFCAVAFFASPLARSRLLTQTRFVQKTLRSFLLVDKLNFLVMRWKHVSKNCSNSLLVFDKEQKYIVVWLWLNIDWFNTFICTILLQRDFLCSKIRFQIKHKSLSVYIGDSSQVTELSSIKNKKNQLLPLKTGVPKY